MYSSTQRKNDPTKAEKDLVQAVTLATILVEQEGASLRKSYRSAPPAIRSAAAARLPRIEALLARHPQTQDEFRDL